MFPDRMFPGRRLAPALWFLCLVVLFGGCRSLVRTRPTVARTEIQTQISRQNVLAAALSAATSALVDDGRYAVVYERWFGASPGTDVHPYPPLGETTFPEPDGELKAILDTGRIRFGLALMGPPYSEEKDGALIGWDIEFGVLLADALAGHYGVDLEAVPVRLPGDHFPSHLFDALDQGECDAVLSDLAITEQRRQRVNFSRPYLTVTFGLLSHCAGSATEFMDAEFTDVELTEVALANRPETTVIVLRHAFLNELAERHLPAATKVFVEDPLEIPLALLGRRAHTALLPFPAIRAYQKNHPELCASKFQIGPGALRGIATRKAVPDRPAG